MEVEIWSNEATLLPNSEVFIDWHSRMGIVIYVDMPTTTQERIRARWPNIEPLLIDRQKLNKSRAWTNPETQFTQQHKGNEMEEKNPTPQTRKRQTRLRDHGHQQPTRPIQAQMPHTLTLQQTTAPRLELDLLQKSDPNRNKRHLEDQTTPEEESIKTESETQTPTLDPSTAESTNEPVTYNTDTPNDGNCAPAACIIATAFQYWNVFRQHPRPIDITTARHLLAQHLYKYSRNCLTDQGQGELFPEHCTLTLEQRRDTLSTDKIWLTQAACSILLQLLWNRLLCSEEETESENQEHTEHHINITDFANLHNEQMDHWNNTCLILHNEHFTVQTPARIPRHLLHQLPHRNPNVPTLRGLDK